MLPDATILTAMSKSNFMMKLVIHYLQFFTVHLMEEQLRVGKVSPIFKVGSIEEVGNYKPTSVLPIFSKVLERIMYNKLCQCFKQNDMFFPKKFGSQVSNSTPYGILNVTDDIFTPRTGQFTLGVSIDLLKAFYTVNHCILLTKLELYEIKGLNWFKNHLKLRQQFTSLSKNQNSIFRRITYGVP